MLDKEIMRETIAELSQQKNFKKLDNTSKKLKQKIELLVPVKKAVNIGKYASSVFTGISGLAYVVAEASQNTPVAESMGEILPCGIGAVALTVVGSKFLDEFNYRLMSKRSDKELMIKSTIKHKYVSKKLEKDGLPQDLNNIIKEQDQFIEDLSDESYDNGKDFDCMDYME